MPSREGAALSRPGQLAAPVSTAPEARAQARRRLRDSPNQENYPLGEGSHILSDQTPNDSPQPDSTQHAVGIERLPPRNAGLGTRRIVLAVMASVVVLAGITAGGILLLGGRSEDSASGPPEAAATPQDPSQAPADVGPSDTPRPPKDPRRGAHPVLDPVVADDWQVVSSSRHQAAFDVPAEWSVNAETDGSFWTDTEDSQAPVLSLLNTATYLTGSCADNPDFSPVTAGYRSAQGTTGTEAAARETADQLLWAAYNQSETGTPEVSGVEPFTNEHGLRGHIAYTSIEDAPAEESGCGSPQGRVIAVSFLNGSSELSVWALVAATGFNEELTEDTIEQIIGSLRPDQAG